MKKTLVFAFLMALVLGASAQELILIGGGGLSKTDTVSTGNYGFAQARLMIPVTAGLRIGPYLGYVQYGGTELNKTPHAAFLGKEFSYGISFDSYGHLSYATSYYFWLNTGAKQVSDKFEDNLYKSDTKTKEFFASGGFFLTDDWLGWFGNNRIMFDYQKPSSAKISATWKGSAVTSTPYNKESLRLFLESGVKRFGNENSLNVEPLIHLGYGQDFGRSQNYYEIGGGLDLGLFKEYYRDVLKVKVFYRKDFSGQIPGTLCGELVFNASSLIQAIRKNK